MTLSIPLSPQAEANLKAQAAAAGLEIPVLAAQILERAVIPAAIATPNEAMDSVRDFDSTLEELFNQDSRTLPKSSLTYSRSDIYSDHD